MSDYTPTTEEVAEAVTEWAWSRRMFRPELSTNDGQEFARWLAAHDAEIRADALAEQGTEEPEWEYGNEQLMHSHVEVFPASSEAVAKAQAWLYPIRRRRKAGPWLPTPDNEGEN